ncbi:BrnA antitoxin family protein [Rhizobium sp. CG5]|uniref:BrnA antitoxin family protein n=1 Tax=Rhizobium sp. CG5 TaxID=2726076 RepID=UPI00203331A5|nr:BrnA antitoxin family protein [Rhizobium sp. CG5]MCM2473725.1 BrnA antitoxin family protein [Rhizobium sp. CG5]
MTENKKRLQHPSDHLLPLTDAEGEVREMTEEDFSHFRPTRDVVPDGLAAWEKARGQRGPQKAPVKERVGLRLNQEVVEHFRKTGPGWQSRINDVLADYVKASGIE